MEWYNKKSEDIEKELDSNLSDGLSSSEAKARFEKYGPNALEEGKKKTIWAKLAEQLLDPMILILVFAAILSAVISEISDAIIIILIVVLNAALSIYQEGKAEQAIEALQKMASPNAKVFRDGEIITIPSSELVPGDIVELETGDIVPADLRLVESSNLKIEEASLTGESVPVEKDAKITFDDVVEIGDRDNMSFSSTIVSYGRGKGIVIGTGKHTEIGRIATRIQSFDDEQTPLQKKLAQLSKVLGIIVVVVCLIVLATGLLYGHELLSMVMTSVSLAVAAIPEGLPAIVTIVLSLGMTRMAKRNAIVKKLLAVETLGTTTFICSDKTGTLTQNEMTVVKAFVDNKEIEITGTGYEPKGELLIDGKKVDENNSGSLYTFLNIGTLTNDARLIEENGVYSLAGDPTEGSLLTLAGKLNITRESANEMYPRIEEIPFDSTRKMMTTFHDKFIEGKVVSFTKGAPDIIIDKCSKILIDGKIKDLDEATKQNLLEQNIKFARQALRVLALAFKTHDSLPNSIDSENIENEMIFVGLAGMIDPARPEVKDAIKECRSAGIVPVMITGDYLETALAIAKDLGIAERDDQAIMGKELNNMSEEEIRQVVKEKTVFARVSPENKVQIVTALKENGEITAMTGDGVNDAPAIKKADIGIAMGITGTDVAKNTADVILTDDNFATIVHAVEEGRIIYSNIKKFVSFLLSCNVGEILVIFLAIIFNWPTPLLAVQLLWLNLVTDSFPALALGVEQGEKDIMEQEPRDPAEPIIDKHLTISIAIQSIGITVAVLVAYYLSLNLHIEGNWQELHAAGALPEFELREPRSIAFVTLIMAELLRSFSVRSTKYTVFELGIFTNKRLIQGVGFSFLLTLIVIYVPFLRDWFETFPLGLKDWAIVLPLSFLPFIIGEVSKLIRRRK
ncbi:cation-translocating P-type ATPase [Miniphocaeibacter halophilus]|uniref:Cation-translocating P-type ATPase n=1 Tax=Miniphocaeibacter halophilus TaxID=2931922 RepID=A0AC61N306_9FIRM|nr:cation-translocating P-type ATPase [Miniphocaeibacter halophilus]QQK08891.1 cation-translocating P-type ATPase [Miniphocaeibacter halophilus]